MYIRRDSFALIAFKLSLYDKMVWNIWNSIIKFILITISDPNTITHLYYYIVCIPQLVERYNNIEIPAVYRGIVLNSMLLNSVNRLIWVYNNNNLLLDSKNFANISILRYILYVLLSTSSYLRLWIHLKDIFPCSSFQWFSIKRFFFSSLISKK